MLRNDKKICERKATKNYMYRRGVNSQWNGKAEWCMMEEHAGTDWM